VRIPAAAHVANANAEIAADPDRAEIEAIRCGRGLLEAHPACVRGLTVAELKLFVDGYHFGLKVADARESWGVVLAWCSGYTLLGYLLHSLVQVLRP
jgi:hypothetical protein